MKTLAAFLIGAGCAAAITLGCITLHGGAIFGAVLYVVGVVIYLCCEIDH